jgi:hypothetical protein
MWGKYFENSLHKLLLKHENTLHATGWVWGSDAEALLQFMQQCHD